MKNKVIAVINGPNINLTGIREKAFYGCETWNSIEKRIEDLGYSKGITTIFFQSNSEGSIIDFIQEYLDEIDGIVINPAALTGYGYGILDAIMSVHIPYVEVHMSNIFAREEWHHKSIFVSNAVGRVIGFGGFSYELALLAILDYLLKNEQN